MIPNEITGTRQHPTLLLMCTCLQFFIDEKFCQSIYRCGVIRVEVSEDIHMKHKEKASNERTIMKKTSFTLKNRKRSNKTPLSSDPERTSFGVLE